jgi:hypothetical protein
MNGPLQNQTVLVVSRGSGIAKVTLVPPLTMLLPRPISS